LINLRVLPVALQVDSLFDSRLPEHMMASPRTPIEAQVAQEITEVIEGDRRVGIAAENALQERATPCHRLILPLDGGQGA
jgi:hypothetical protein